MTQIMRFTLYGPPRTKKNSQQILQNKRTGRAFIAPSAAYKAYERDCLRQISGLYRAGLVEPVNLKAVYYMPTHRCVDLSNLLSATNDILVRAGVIADDRCEIVVSHDGSRVRYDKGNPRVEITIEEAMGDDTEQSAGGP